MKYLYRTYKSIKNDNEENYIEILKKNSHIRYRAEEKIHGVNVQCMTDGESVEWASRNKVLIPGESFHNIWNYTQAMELKCMEISKELGKPITMYFEYYSGDDSIINKSSIPYREAGVKDFVALDILLIDLENLEDKYLHYSKLLEMCTKHSIPLVGNYKRNLTLQEALDLDIDSDSFESILASQYGNTGVKIEGIVFKAENNEEAFVNVDHDVVPIGRALFKRICKSHTQRLHASSSRSTVGNSNRVEDVVEVFEPLLTQSRLYSKIAAEGIESSLDNVLVAAKILCADIMKETGLPQEYLNIVNRYCKVFVYKEFKNFSNE